MSTGQRAPGRPSAPASPLTPDPPATVLRRAPKQQASTAESPIEAKLAAGVATATRLREATDHLNAALESFESALVELKLGVGACVTIDRQTAEATPFDWFQEVSFQKSDGQWRLVINSGMDSGDPEDWHTVSVTKASRAVRLKAVKKLPDLLDKLLDEAAAKVAEVENATAEVSAITRSVAAVLGRRS